MAVTDGFKNLIRESILWGNTFYIDQARIKIRTDQGTESGYIDIDTITDNGNSIDFSYTWAGGNATRHYLGQTTNKPSGDISEVDLEVRIPTIGGGYQSSVSRYGVQLGHTAWLLTSTESITSGSNTDYDFNDHLENFKITLTPQISISGITSVNLVDKFLDSSNGNPDLVPHTFNFKNQMNQSIGTTANIFGDAETSVTSSLQASGSATVNDSSLNVTCDVGLDNLSSQPYSFELKSNSGIVIDSGTLLETTTGDWLSGDSLKFTYTTTLLKKL
tara:strand:- start:3864 stop:4688 length:825 start_codon:yes stop_codon:yes gene_type:complete